MYWLDALELILRANKLWYEEYADYIKIVPLTEVTGVTAPAAPTEEEKAKVEFETREVMISAVFFEADASKLKQYGFSWDFFRGKGVNLGITMSAAEGKSGLFTVDVSPDLDFGSLVAVFKALESQQIGEVVANPRITVRSGQEGQIQVGSDVSTTVRDFAGNAITQFISTGSIIRVKPQVIRYDTIYFINLNLSIERSNAAQVAVGQIIINKSSAQTSVLLLDGEETIIGGLYVNEERTTREGVPILKDLPWWFFGLRYLFGFDVKTTVKKELIILLKAEILPTLAERLKERAERISERPTLREKREELLKALENYKRQLKSK
jgi:type IV pilus assembly protein PilQ